MDYKLLNGADLAYIGDAYYELEIRKYLLNKNITKSKELKELSIKYVSAMAHYYIFEELKTLLSEEEINVFNRGRNGAPNGRRKNIERKWYVTSSGFEALIGYLYLKGDKQRLDEIMKKSIEIVESRLC